MIKHQPNKKEIIYLAVFGGIWGAVELTIGTALQVAKIPMRGMLLTFFASVLLIVARRLIEFRGALIIIGAVCVGFKVMYMGGFVIMPVIAIIAQAFIAEISFFFFRYSLFSAIFTGIAVMLYTIIHMLGAHLLFFGFDIINIYESIYRELLKLLPLPIENFFIFASLLVIIYLAVGAIAGIMGHRIANRTVAKLNSNYDGVIKH